MENDQFNAGNSEKVLRSKSLFIRNQISQRIFVWNKHLLNLLTDHWFSRTILWTKFEWNVILTKFPKEDISEYYLIPSRHIYCKYINAVKISAYRVYNFLNKLISSCFISSKKTHNLQLITSFSFYCFYCNLCCLYRIL